LREALPWLKEITHVISIDTPFPEEILKGRKHVETRHYPLAPEYFGVNLGIVEKGTDGRKWIVGMVRGAQREVREK
jgi:hypothetical protein